MNLLLVIVSFTSFSRLGELCAIASFSFAFGGWLSLVINYNPEDTSSYELFFYYFEHVWVAFFGPIVMSVGGRYNMLSYLKFPLPWFGFMTFNIYMRYILMGFSRLTWANLNHTLCGLKSDIFYTHFELGESYFLYGDIYVFLLCMSGYLINTVIVTVVLKFCGFNQSDKIDKTA